MSQKIPCTRILMALALITLFLPSPVSGHCDALDGPVVVSAKKALETGDPTGVLKWVSEQDEPEIRALFQKTLALREKGPDVRELADTYFFETVVRLHRASEGAPYTGLKLAGSVEPIIALSDKALESGNADELVEQLTAKVAAGIREKFAHAQEARAHADHSVEAGRAFVTAYVAFTHYAEGIHGAAAGHDDHRSETPEGQSSQPVRQHRH
jgi:hypothetical protein